MTGLHLAALFHAITPDPLMAASSNALHRAITLLTHRADALLIRGRPAHHVFDALRHLDSHYHRGQRRRDFDHRTHAQLALDRDTGRVVTLARLYAWTGNPQRAVALLRERADQAAAHDHERRDGVGSAALTTAADSIATLFFPAPTQLERLRTARTGDFVIEPATDCRERTPPERIWRILVPAHHLTPTPAGVEEFDVLAYDESQQHPARFIVRPAHPEPGVHRPPGPRPMGPAHPQRRLGGVASHRASADHQQRGDRRRHRLRVRPQPAALTRSTRPIAQRRQPATSGPASRLDHLDGPLHTCP